MGIFLHDIILKYMYAKLYSEYSQILPITDLRLDYYLIRLKIVTFLKSDKILTLCMLGHFFKYFFFSKDAKNQCFLPNILLIYKLNVKQFGSQMKPHILWGFIWIQIVCIGHQQSSKFTASGLRAKKYSRKMGQSFQETAINLLWSSG